MPIARETAKSPHAVKPVMDAWRELSKAEKKLIPAKLARSLDALCEEKFFVGALCVREHRHEGKEAFPSIPLEYSLCPVHRRALEGQSGDSVIQANKASLEHRPKTSRS